METKTKSHKIAAAFIDLNDQYTQAILAAVVAVILTTIIILLVTRNRSKRQKVLVLGLCNSGKTCMFSWLVYQQSVMTQTSIKENDSIYKTSRNKNLQLLDLPGHERLRQQTLDEHKSQTRGVIFVLDSQTMSKEVKDVADYLYSLLTDTIITRLHIPILIACNKQDLTLSKSSKVIRSQLEKELDAVRITAAAALASTADGAGGDSATNGLVGRSGGGELRLDALPHNPVAWAECSSSANRNAMNLDDVRAWLDRL